MTGVQTCALPISFLKLRSGDLSKLADLQRKEALRRRLEDPLVPLFKDVRELMLRKCRRDHAKEIRAIFEKQAFGELERLVTQTLLEVVKSVAKEHLEREPWLRMVARLGDRSYKQMRVMVLEFLDTDVFNLSPQHCVAFLEPLIESWDIDLAMFEMEIVLHRRLASSPPKTFAFLEREPDPRLDEEPSLKEFLRVTALSSDATGEEIEFLKHLRFNGKRPTPLYYYRELQNLRDPLHFRTSAGAEVQRATVRVRSVVAGDPCASGGQGGRDRRLAGQTPHRRRSNTLNS